MTAQHAGSLSCEAFGIIRSPDRDVPTGGTERRTDIDRRILNNKQQGLCQSSGWREEWHNLLIAGNFPNLAAGQEERTGERRWVKSPFRPGIHKVFWGRVSNFRTIGPPGRQGDAYLGPSG